ncbi:MAG: FAD-binding oxidoreductase [Pirellulales bacterium]
MPASESLPFLKKLVLINSLVPLAMLAWDAWNDQLGANAINIAIHITGIVSLLFLMLTLAISPLRQITGWSGWIAFRRTLGVHAFVYAALHFVLYFVWDRQLNLASTASEVLSRRYLQVGFLALAFMIPLTITSTNRMLQRLGPKHWKLLHRVTYAVAILGVLHYFLLVKSDLRQPILFAIVLGCLFAWRIMRIAQERMIKKHTGRKGATAQVAQVGRQWKGELQVEKINSETPTIKTFRFRFTNGSGLPFTFQPGQYLQIQALLNGKRVTRCYTIASSPSQRDYCEITVKRESMGLFSQHLHDTVTVGDRVAIQAPFGAFTFNGGEASSIALISGGVGATPMMSMVRYLTDREWNGNIVWIAVAKDRSEMLFRSELEALQREHSRLRVVWTLTREEGTDWQGHRGRIDPSLIANIVPELKAVEWFLCGPNSMMEDTQALLEQLGVDPRHIRKEAFQMAQSQASTNDEPQDVNQLPQEVHFLKSDIKVFSQGSTLLEIAEEQNVEIPFECRSGICGQCRTKVCSGNVQSKSTATLSRREIEEGWVLACQSIPAGSVGIDA